MSGNPLWLAAILAMSPSAANAQEDHARTEIQAAYVAGDPSKALALLAPLIAAHPDDPDLLRRLALLQAAQGDLSRAQATIDRANGLAPNDSDIQLARASILLWRGKPRLASLEAAALAARDPAQPGLGELRAGIARSQADSALHLASLGLGGTLSRARFEAGFQRDWASLRTAAELGWGTGSAATLEVEREDRGLVDTRVVGRIDLPIGQNRVHFGATVTPDPDFRESWSLSAGGDLPVSRHITLVADGRYASYRSQDVGVVEVGARAKVANGLAITARSIHLFGGGVTYRIGGVLRADYEYPKGPGLFALVASYPDTEIDGTRQLWSVAGGARVSLDRRLTLRITGEYESRKSSYRRAGASVDLNWRFR